MPYEDKIIADGYRQTVEEAEAKATQVAGPNTMQGPAYWAERRHRLRVHEARKSRPAKAGGAQVRQHVYTTDYGDHDCTRDILAHPILKWTEKRVYVSERSCDAEVIGTEHEPTFHHGPDDRAIVLDCARLETDGYAFSRSRRWWGTFYLRLEDALNPSPRRRVIPLCDVIEALAVLGSAWPCSERELRAAYRRPSERTHPDCGGSAKSFVEINDAYETIKAGPVNWPECARSAA